MSNCAYREYTESAHWKRLRADAVTRWGAHCQCCGGDKGVEVHHLTYALGWLNTTTEELMPLCAFHHVKLHGQRKLEWMLRDGRVPGAIKRKIALAYLRRGVVLTVEQAEQCDEEPMMKVYKTRRKGRKGRMAVKAKPKPNKDLAKEQARRSWSAGRLEVREKAAKEFGWIK